MCRVQILMPVFNTQNYLAEAMESLLSQTESRWELLALNDGSTDESEKILSHYAQRDSRISFISRANRGLVATRNELLHMASCNLIAWMDSDDRSLPHRLERQCQQMAENPRLVLLGSAVQLIDPSGLPICVGRFPSDHHQICQEMAQEVAFYFPTVIMRRQLALHLGGFRHPFSIAEDYDLCLRMAEVGPVANSPEILVEYRQHMSSTANRGRAHTYHYSALVRELAQERRSHGQDRLQRGETIELEFPPQPPQSQNVLETHQRWAWWALSAGNVLTARKYARKSLFQHPLSLQIWKLALCSLRGY